MSVISTNNGVHLHKRVIDQLNRIQTPSFYKFIIILSFERYFLFWLLSSSASARGMRPEQASSPNGIKDKEIRIPFRLDSEDAVIGSINRLVSSLHDHRSYMGSLGL